MIDSPLKTTFRRRLNSAVLVSATHIKESQIGSPSLMYSLVVSSRKYGLSICTCSLSTSCAENVKYSIWAPRALIPNPSCAICRIRLGAFDMAIPCAYNLPLYPLLLCLYLVVYDTVPSSAPYSESVSYNIFVGSRMYSSRPRGIFGIFPSAFVIAPLFLHRAPFLFYFLRFVAISGNTVITPSSLAFTLLAQFHPVGDFSAYGFKCFVIV